MKLPKTYEPNIYEKDVYTLWEKSGSFSPRVTTSGGRFSMVMPPPNANDNLHMGHALMAGLEDIVARYQRLRGRSVLYIPGADHAGFETWVVYEKQLAKKGKTRFDFNREELYQQVWDFVQLNKANFNTQLRSLGVSSDWSKFTFTLDDKVVKQAYALFKQMWHDKLIYRGERLVNFCTYHGTSFADIEVVYKTEHGNLWYIAYPLTKGKGSIKVATTRPETMLGDTAVAVNPKDKRYQRFIGKTVKLPLSGREVPIVADDMVDMKFGTGAVKITPAHDMNDYDVAQRHSLPMISVINTDGTMADNVPEPYRGLNVLDARGKVVADLREQGRLVKEESLSHSVGHCYKCDTTIQPLLREQWFVDMKPLAKKAITQLKAGKIKFYPKGKLEQSINYIEGLRDWNISRQIAWGIPIPAFQNVDDPTDWVYDERVTLESIAINGKTYRRDPDVFDTWFSSGQWPYVTLGYPSDAEFNKYYPLDLMETGGDILYQWVCRMIMLGLYVTGKVPFKSVYIHSTVLAPDGKKMSKSIGNVINPMPLIDKYGSDAVRMGIISGRLPGVNRSLDLRKIVDARNFCNKIWNIARFIEDKIGDNYKKQKTIRATSTADAWILERVQDSNNKMKEALDKYDFNVAFETIYHLIWDEVADWYVESAKVDTNYDVLAYVLETILRLAHPFAPFVTEVTWQTLQWEPDSLLINAKWPSDIPVHKEMAEDFEIIKTLITEIRFIKNVLKPKRQLELHYNENPLVKQNAKLIKSLSKIGSVKEKSISTGLRLNSTFNCWLELTESEIFELINAVKIQFEKQSEIVKKLNNRLNNKHYVMNAPAAIVNESKDELAIAKRQLSELKDQLSKFDTVIKP